MCGGPMSILNQDEVISGIITWENDESTYRFHPCKDRNKLKSMLCKYQLPHKLFPEQVQGKIITAIVAKRKYVREMRQKLNAFQPFQLAA